MKNNKSLSKDSTEKIFKQCIELKRYQFVNRNPFPIIPLLIQVFFSRNFLQLILHHR